jgi:CubicO group peptidase (beta-lactamase class C family)
MKTTASLLVLLSFIGCVTLPNKTPAFDAAAIDAEATRLMARKNVQGMALAVIEEGRVVHVAAYGRRNVERYLPLTTDTVMYGASLTKTAFAYMLLQLVDEGRLSLDASMAELLPRPLPEYDDFKNLAGDER